MTTTPAEATGPADPTGPAELLDALRARDVRLWEEDGRLRFNAPAGAFDQPLRDRVAAHRAELVALLRRARGGRGPERPPIERAARDGDVVPLSFGQRRMWVMSEMLPASGAAAYVLAGRVRLAGDVGPATVDALAWALGEVVRRHEALRTVVRSVAGEPVARVVAECAVPLPELRLAEGQSLDEVAAAEARRPFDLAEAPLLRAALVHESPGVAHLLLAVHHSSADAWSLGVLYRELAALHAARVRGTDPALPDLPVRYADYAAWQRTHLTAAALGDDLAYWRDRLAGAPQLLELPTDRPRPAVQSHRGETVTALLPADLLARMRELAHARGCTPFMVLLATWSALLARLSGAPDLTLGTPVAGRVRPEVEPLIGFFVNTLVLRVDADGDPSFAGLLDRVRDTALGAFDHQDLPFEQLVDELQPSRTLSHSPLFQHMVILQNATTERFQLPGLDAELTEVSTGTAKFDTTLLAEERPEGLRVTLEYACDLYDAATARRWLGHWRTLLTAALDAPDTALSALPLLTGAERRLLLEEWNDTAVPVPATTVHALVERQAAATPDRDALVQGEVALSYAELDAAADRLAARLRARGARPGVLVGLCLPRTPDLVVTLLAILKSGAAYLPLDPAAPAERNAHILRDARARLLVTPSTAAAPLACPAGTEPFPLDEAFPLDESEPAGDGAGAPEPAGDGAGGAGGEPPAAAGPEDLAYVIYTSGSTGRPKGVMVQHDNVVNFLTAMTEEFGADGVGTWLGVTTVSFDISVLELLWTLTQGSTVVLRGDAPRPARRGPGRVADLSLFYFSSTTETEGQATPGAYRLLLEGARFADAHGFEAVWTPERHFHAFGGIYPNPSVVSAAVAAVTERVAVRAGSVVLPLHHPLRVAEEWAVVDNLSGGRVGLSVASGWQADDFVLAPERYAERKRVMLDGVDTLRALWEGQAVELPNGVGRPTAVRSLPRPVQRELPLWVTAAGSEETFRAAGEAGCNLLTHLLTQDLDQLAERIAAYRRARAEAGHPGPGRVTLMAHTLVGHDPEAVRATVRAPFRAYLASSLGLIANLARGLGFGDDLGALSDEDRETLLDHAVDRFADSAALFGTPERVAALLDEIADLGVDEVACLIDFGVADDAVLAALPALDAARRLHADRNAAPEASVSELIERHGVTQLQCTPSQVAMVLEEPGGPAALARLKLLLLGGEELPAELAARVTAATTARVQNMYGPTETTIWSTTHRVDTTGTALIGRPLANTTAHVLDARGAPVPIGVPGTLHLGGAGVARGYLGRAELTAERFRPAGNPADPGGRRYDTGDLVRYRPDGTLEFLGRTDHQVKVRGYRVELGEIEAALRAHPDVARAAATVHGTGVERAVAGYVVPRPGAAVPGEAALRDHLAARLPAYMVPASLRVLDALPHTPNGKVDRAALPAPSAAEPSAAGFVAPRGLTEMRLAALWGATLGRRAVGAHDDFFRLGGNSVLAVRLLAEVERQFGSRLALATLFQGPTVAQLAAALDRGGDVARRSLVPLRPGGDTPVYLLPGAGGNLVYFRELVSALPEHLTVYGLQPSFEADVAPESLVAELADRYLPLVLENQPEGPYRFVGHSFGGHVAVELARRLVDAGRAVALTGLLDTAAPLPERAAHFAAWDQATWLATLARVFERLFDRPLGVSREDLAALPEAEQLRHLRDVLAGAGVLPPELADEHQLRGFVRTYVADQRSLHTPSAPYPGTLTFYRAAELHEDNVPPEALAWTLDDPTRGWQRFSTRPVEVREVPGDHLTMLTSPHVAALAKLVGDVADR